MHDETPAKKLWQALDAPIGSAPSASSCALEARS